MKKLIVSALALLSTFSLAFGQSREGLTEYKLDNGLTVLLWEDHDQPDVTGYVAVRAGSIDEPAEYTGLAHYLEHMLFKGTDRIGALDWEKEKVHYENIIALYDSCAVETDEAKRQYFITRINEESIEAAKYATCEDFFILMDGIGATATITTRRTTLLNELLTAKSRLAMSTIASNNLDGCSIYKLHA